MKFNLPWNKKPNAELPKPTPVAIDFSVPREMIMLPLSGEPGPCPRCGGALEQTYATYLIATRQGKRIADSFIMGSDFGWFCLRCPTLVINTNQVSQMLRHSLPHWNVGNEFAVMGIVNMDAVPENQRDVPLGDDDNPIPLVEFTNSRSARGDKARKKHKKQRRRK